MTVKSRIGWVAAAQWTRPNDTTAYAAGDLIANSVTAGSVVPMSFDISRDMKGGVLVARARLRKSGTGIVNASFGLNLYRASPTPTNGDNGAFLTDQSDDYLGRIDFSASNAKAFSDGAVVVGVPAVGSAMLVIPSSGMRVYGLLEALAAYTPTAQETWDVGLELNQD